MITITLRHHREPGALHLGPISTGLGKDRVTPCQAVDMTQELVWIEAEVQAQQTTAIGLPDTPMHITNPLVLQNSAMSVETSTVG